MCSVRTVVHSISALRPQRSAASAPCGRPTNPGIRCDDDRERDVAEVLTALVMQLEDLFEHHDRDGMLYEAYADALVFIAADGHHAQHDWMWIDQQTDIDEETD